MTSPHIIQCLQCRIPMTNCLKVNPERKGFSESYLIRCDRCNVNFFVHINYRPESRLNAGLPKP